MRDHRTGLIFLPPPYSAPPCHPSSPHHNPNSLGHHRPHAEYLLMRYPAPTVTDSPASTDGPAILFDSGTTSLSGCTTISGRVVSDADATLNLYNGHSPAGDFDYTPETFALTADEPQPFLFTMVGNEVLITVSSTADPGTPTLVSATVNLWKEEGA